MLKRTLVIFPIFVVVVGLLYLNLPFEILRKSDINRGNELIQGIEQYYKSNEILPNNGDWKSLKSIGFTEDEMETSFPEYQKINDSTYQVIFVLGFDPPYLMWVSNEKMWIEGFPRYYKN